MKKIFGFIFAMMLGFVVSSCTGCSNANVSSADSTSVDTVLVDSAAVDSVVAVADTTVVAE